MPTRRELLHLTGAGAIALGLGCRGRGPAEPPPPEPSPAVPPAPPAPPLAATDDAALDEVLEMLHAQEPRSKQGLSTHAPMVAEALCALGFAHRARPWVEGYAAPVIVVPSPGQRIERDRWREVLGPASGAPTWEAQIARWGDWKLLFLEELRDARWQDVLDLWVGRLAPGLAAAATHGVIRTAHAARALARRDTAVRRAELARGLAYWAAAYEELPVRAAASPRAADFEAALAQIPLCSDRSGGAPRRSVVAGLRDVAGLAGFADARDLVAVPANLGAGLSALTATFARVFLRHGTGDAAVALVHAITAPCALRRIATHVSPGTARLAFPYAWQAAAALYAGYARRDAPARPAEPKLPVTELPGRAVENGADHAIKLVEALLAEHALRPDPAYLAAAEAAVARL
ncbi:MAG TPA: hypothetical protein VNO30_44970 [Kofleriaceae bacterium]|nr:hypothetical protein [Kofleriaceae bacterium]